jgi:hypothetical protein
MQGVRCDLVGLTCKQHKRRSDDHAERHLEERESFEEGLLENSMMDRKLDKSKVKWKLGKSMMECKLEKSMMDWKLG